MKFGAACIKNTLCRFNDWVCKPPYYGLPWVVWLYAFLCLFTYTHGQGVMTGHIIGFDDHVRMTQVLNWINGAGWYDRVIHRVNPPDGFKTIWSRIVDIPIAAVVLAAQQFTDQRTAALIAGAVVPFAELAILFAVAAWAARPLAGKNNARLIVLFLMFTTVLNPKQYTWAGFHPGEASHRPWYVILNVLMYGAMARLAMGARGPFPLCMMALSIGLSLAVGIEGFPMIAGAVAILVITAWWFKYPALARRAAIAVGGGAALSLLLLPMHQPPESWLDASFAEPSIVGPVSAGAAALFLALEDLILSRLSRRDIAAIVLMFLAAAMAAVLVYVFPQILDGPGAALSPAERKLAFFEHHEVWPMYKAAFNKIDFVALAAPTVIALIAGVVAVRGAASRRRRMMYASYLGFAALAGGMAQGLWRYYHHALTAACPWLLWSWGRLKAKLRRNLHYGLLVFLSYVALGPFWMLLLPALEYNAPIASHVVFYPVATQTLMNICDTLTFSKYLNANYDRRTNIVVRDWFSDEFTYYTNLTVDFLSNFPSQDKFIDNKLFFETQDPNVAADITLRHHIDLVAMCPYMQPQLPPLPTMEELMNARRVPAWLRQVELDPATSGRYRLFAVDREVLMKGQPKNEVQK